MDGPNCHKSALESYWRELTHTSALRLYRLPRASQLLRRLGPHWHVPGQSDFPLVITRSSRTGAGRTTQRPTALEALAARIPSDGPRVDLKAIAPWEVPNWAAQLTYMGVVRPWVRTAWTRDFTWSAEGLSILACHCAAVLSNQGPEDDKVAGGLAVTFSAGGNPFTALTWSAGERLTQFDADALAIAKTAEALAIYYMEEVPPPDNTFIFSSNSSALMAVKNPRSQSSHASSLMFHQALTTITLRHRATRYYLIWTPVDMELEGQGLARHIALEACRTVPQTRQRDFTRSSRRRFRRHALENGHTTSGSKNGIGSVPKTHYKCGPLESRWTARPSPTLSPHPRLAITIHSGKRP